MTTPSSAEAADQQPERPRQARWRRRRFLQATAEGAIAGEPARRKEQRRGPGQSWNPPPPVPPVREPAHLRGFWLVRPDGTLSPTGKYFHDLWQRAS